VTSDNWTDAEREVWAAWSHLGQDLSQPDASLGCGQVLDTLEASLRRAAQLQSTTLRVTYAVIEAHPLMPSMAQTWARLVYQPVIAAGDLQQYMIAAWLAVARRLMTGT
jgi:hypothetical protein